MSVPTSYKRDHAEWLGFNSLVQVGGRSTDIGQIGQTLYGLVRDYYPINKVPAEVLQKINDLISELDQCESDIAEFIEFMNKETSNDKEA